MQAAPTGPVPGPVGLGVVISARGDRGSMVGSLLLVKLAFRIKGEGGARFAQDWGAGSEVSGVAECSTLFSVLFGGGVSPRPGLTEPLERDWPLADRHLHREARCGGIAGLAR